MKMLFCGDFVCQKVNFKVSEELKSLIETSDFAALNFEAPIAKYCNPIHKSGPGLKQPIEAPGIIEQLGFNIIMLANNHMLDMGKESCEATIDSFRNSITLGVGGLDDAFRVKVVAKDGVKVGLLNLVQKEFGCLDLDSNFGTAWINHPIVSRNILKARSMCDYLIILPHAGLENIEVPLPEWRAKYKELIELGADCIIAGHTHTPQGWELYKNKPIFYSMGNFLFQSNFKSVNLHWNNGRIIEINISKECGLTYNVINTRYNKGRLEIDHSFEETEYNRYLCEIIECKDKYEECVNKSLLRVSEMYKLYNLRGLGAISMRCSMSTFVHALYGFIKGKDLPMLLNNYQCETHNWAMQRIIKLKS